MHVCMCSQVRGGLPDLARAWADLRPRLAMQYPFELDTFQKEAVVHLERGNSVSMKTVQTETQTVRFVGNYFDFV